MNYSDWVISTLEAGVAYVAYAPTQAEREAWLMANAEAGAMGEFSQEEEAIIKAHYNAPVWLERA